MSDGSGEDPSAVFPRRGKTSVPARTRTSQTEIVDMKNPLVSRIFRNIAEILEIKGENVFRIRAYQKAADTIEGLSEDIATYAAEDRLSEIPGIGVDLSAKIKEIVATGKLAFYEELKKTIPEGLLELLAIPS